ncbi:MAG: hypothetical protein P4M08_03970 [Oligoflexia bacterium]|nr:hypothetical protein [Oligoflexia bacterium]
MIRREKLGLGIVSLFGALQMTSAFAATGAQNPVQVHEITEQQAEALGLAPAVGAVQAQDLFVPEPASSTTPTPAPSADPCANSNSSGNANSPGNNWWDPNAAYGNSGARSSNALTGGPIVASPGSQQGSNPAQNCPGSANGGTGGITTNPPVNNGGYHPNPAPGNLPTNNVLPVMNEVAQGVNILNNIIQLGENVLNFIKANEPTQNYQATTVIAVPKAVTLPNLQCNAANAATCSPVIVDWSQLDCQPTPVVKEFDASMNDNSGNKVMDLVFRISLTAGCSYNGAGQYIRDAHFDAVNMNVSGFADKFDATVTVPSVYHVGPDTNPIAAAEMDVAFQNNSIFVSRSGSVNILVTGDGQILNVSSPTAGGKPEQIGQ